MNNTIRSRPIDVNLSRAVRALNGQRGKAFGMMIIGALLAFEVFNFSTTEFALNDVLGNLTFVGIKWSTILSIAFCGIDFAGIARLFTPEQGADEPAEVWYLFGAWILGAAMNATLTWWGVSVAIATHTSQGSLIMSGETIQKVVPVFVAIMVWVIRILIIGTFSIAGERMFSQVERRSSRMVSETPRTTAQHNNPAQRPFRSINPAPAAPTRTNYAASKYQPQHRPTYQTQAQHQQQPAQPVRRIENNYNPPEPTYHNLMTGRELQEIQDERSR